jgi:hypothetical protein
LVDRREADLGEDDSFVIGWLLDDEQRRELLAQFPPSYGAVVARHVTLRANVPPGTPPPAAVVAEIVGEADDGLGVQALVVRIDGHTDRPDGSTYHITWSLGPGRRARESNDVIRKLGWRPLRAPVHVSVRPGRFR